MPTVKTFNAMTNYKCSKFLPFLSAEILYFPSFCKNSIFFKMFDLKILAMVLFGYSVHVESGNDPTPRENLVLLVSFDGFRWDYLNRGLTPTFNAIAARGGKADYTINAYVTKTFPDHYTLVTGLYEESHGLLGNDMYDPVLNDTFSLGNYNPEWWSQNGQVEPIWITNQHQGGSSANIDFPGMNVAFDGMVTDYEHPRYDDSVPPNNNSDLAVELFANGSVNFVALYFKEPDRTGHLSGPDSRELNDTLESCDWALRYLEEKLVAAGLWDRVNMIVTSDHGMTGADINRTIYADRYLDGTRYPYVTTENNPLLGIWPENSSHTDALYEAMKKAPHVTAYKKKDIPPGYRYKNNIRTPPILVAADPGWMLRGNMGEGNYKLYKGNHGYSNAMADMHPLFIVHGPAIKSGSVCEPFNSVDVYPLMCHLLGIEGRLNNGTLETVGALLKVPTPPKNEDDMPSGGQHSVFFILGIAFAIGISLLAV